MNKRIVLNVGNSYPPHPTGGARRFMELNARVPGYISQTITHSLGLPDDSRPGVWRYENTRQMLGMVISTCRRSRISLLHIHNARIAAELLPISRMLPPMVVELHSLPEFARLKYEAIGFVLRRAARTIVLAEAARKWLAENASMPLERIVSIPNGKQEAPSDPGGIASARRSSEPICVYVGSLRAWQGVFEIVKAAQKVHREIPGAKFVFVGEGPDRRPLESLAKGLLGEAQSTVMFVGKVSPAAARDWFRTAAVVLMPRRSTLATETTIPLKVIEAMSAGAAIIASDDGGMREVLGHGDARFVPCGNVDALARACLDLLRDGALRARLGAGALARASGFPTWEQRASELASVYDQVVLEAQ